MASRIESALAKEGLNQSELAGLLSISPQAVQQWTKGKTAPKGKRLTELAKILNVSVEWLISGTGDGIKPRKKEPSAIWLGQIEPWDNDTPLEDDEVELPFFREVEASAGSGSSMVQENHGRKLRFSKNTLKNYNVQPEHAYCITVSGNSMEPAIPHGSTIGVDTNNTAIKDGDIYALDDNGHLRVKVIYKTPRGIRLKSFNIEEWPDESYTHAEAEKIRVLGRVFWWSVLR